MVKLIQRLPEHVLILNMLHVPLNFPNLYIMAFKKNIRNKTLEEGIVGKPVHNLSIKCS